MRILWVCKRQYTGRDLIDDRYGRLREIPLALARRGHQVNGICLSYRPRPEGVVEDVHSGACVRWLALNLWRIVAPLSMNYFARAVDQAPAPELVVAASDVPHLLIGQALAKRFEAPLVVDLYDNFEAFGLTRIPGGRTLHRKIVRLAAGAVVVSRSLESWVRETARREGSILQLGNGVDARTFRALDKGRCREALGLPKDVHIVGTAGALDRSRGIDTLFEAFAALSSRHQDLHLALAGPVGAAVTLPQGARVHHLGMIPPERMPLFWNALDVAVVSNRDSEFGRYCAPQKLQEALACGVPVVAARVGGAVDVLGAESPVLYGPDDAADLARAIEHSLDTRAAGARRALAATWDDLAMSLEAYLSGLLDPGNR